MLLGGLSAAHGSVNMSSWRREAGLRLFDLKRKIQDSVGFFDANLLDYRNRE